MHTRETDFERLNRLLIAGKLPPEISSQLLIALSQAVDAGPDFDGRAETVASLRRSGMSIAFMNGMRAEEEWAKLPFVEKLRLGFKAQAWQDARTSELISTGRQLAWPNGL
jgi:hypothetical protein